LVWGFWAAHHHQVAGSILTRRVRLEKNRVIKGCARPRGKECFPQILRARLSTLRIEIVDRAGVKRKTK